MWRGRRFRSGSGAVCLSFTRLCHPERSRFSGLAKDLPLNRPTAQAKLHHYPGARLDLPWPLHMTDNVAKMLPCRSKTLRKVQSKILHADSLTPLPWLIHGFSTRPGGFSRAYGRRSLNLGFTREDQQRAVEQNRAAFLRKLGAIRRGASGRWLPSAKFTPTLFIAFLKSPRVSLATA